jgi:hypothetical protein
MLSRVGVPTTRRASPTPAVASPCGGCTSGGGSSHASMPVIDLEKPCEWPDDLRRTWTGITTFPPLGNGTEQGHRCRYDSQSVAFERFEPTRADRVALHPSDRSGGSGHPVRRMRLPDDAMLHLRIDAVAAAGMLSLEVAARLKAEHQADEQWRAGMVWFCFYPPRLAGESGIERFLRHWRRGALQLPRGRPGDGHGDQAHRSPCVVEAEVPIASLRPHGGLAAKVARRHLVGRGHRTAEPLHHEMRPSCRCGRRTSAESWHSRRRSSSPSRAAGPGGGRSRAPRIGSATSMRR